MLRSSRKWGFISSCREISSFYVVQELGSCFDSMQYTERRAEALKLPFQEDTDDSHNSTSGRPEVQPVSGRGPSRGTHSKPGAFFRVGRSLRIFSRRCCHPPSRKAREQIRIANSASSHLFSSVPELHTQVCGGKWPIERNAGINLFIAVASLDPQNSFPSPKDDDSR
ncbi:uncharacterized protein ARMOST_21288 [Armillaria ostoyae]|uniref:Uncharacterized protein n=1 Tax=Armillaria ostoyae TaxID=47428 RepID=A0A284S9N4_ARMOS|nr:uncharacterized protein ARMOST_21288 [Armillaria ostoyae]